MSIKTIHAGAVTWENVIKPGKKDLSYLEKNYRLEREDLNECLPPLQRNKIVLRPEYIFVILQFPLYHRKSREIRSIEVDFFIRSSALITVHDSKLAPIGELFNTLQESKTEQKKLMGQSPAPLLHEVLDRLLKTTHPMLNNLALNIDRVEEQMFRDKPNSDTIRDLLIIKRNIVNFRKTMQAHKNIMERLIQGSRQRFPAQRLNRYLADLTDHTKEIWLALENYRDTVNALHETNESLSSHRLNIIMKTLTIFSVIVFPLTLLAAIFGMNTINMPFVGDEYGFWVIIGIMLVGTIAMFGFFKWRKWL